MRDGIHTAGIRGDKHRVRARVRVTGKVLEGDDGHTIAPLYRNDTQDKGIVRMYVASLRRLKALAPNFQPSLVMFLSA